MANSGEQRARFMYPSGATYEGAFVISEAGAKVAQGQGRYVDGHASYEGHFERGVYHGAGLFVSATGSVYEGGFVEGKFAGQGSYKWADGATYVGEWADNKMHGAGAYSGADGCQYVGQFYAGTYHTGTTHLNVRGKRE
jgi:hypothetical protein